jgi:hypothetical protein
MPVPGTSNEFLDLVQNSGLVDQTRLNAYLVKPGADVRPETPAALAELLVRQAISRRRYATPSLIVGSGPGLERPGYHHGVATRRPGRVDADHSINSHNPWVGADWVERPFQGRRSMTLATAPGLRPGLTESARRAEENARSSEWATIMPDVVLSSKDAPELSRRAGSTVLVSSTRPFKHR